MIGNKRKQKSTIDRGIQDDIKEVKLLLGQGKMIVERATSELQYGEALQIFSKAISKISSIQVANTYMLYYYRGICFMNLTQYAKAERDFIEGLSIADEKGRIQLYNSLGKCKVKMAEEDPAYIDEAIKNFQKAIELSKNSDGDSYISLGNIYKKLQNYAQAVIYYSSALKLFKSVGSLHQIHMDRGKCYRELGQLQKSTKDFSTACQLRKNDADSQFNLGLNYLLTEKNQIALTNFEMAIDLDPSNPNYLNYKGLSLYNLDHLQNSLGTFKEALQLYQNQHYQNQKTSQTWYNMGNCLFKMGKNSEALKALEMSQQFCSNDSLKLKIYYSQGLAFQGLNNQSEAIDKFQKTLSLISDQLSHQLYLSSLYHLGSSLFKLKRYSDALQYFTKILESGCNDQCVYEIRGKVYLQAQMYEQALKDFETMLSMDRNNPAAYYYLGKAKTHLSDIDSAIADFLKAMELGSKASQIINGISCAYLKINKPQKALVYANIALDRIPNNDQFLIQRSIVYIQLKEYHKSIQDLTNVLKVTTTNPFIYYQRGVSYYRYRQFQSAIEDLSKALEFNPNRKIQPDIYYLIGISYANLQNFSEAIDPLTKAIELEEIPRYYHERSKCYLLLDQQAEALSDLNKVIEAQPENAFAYFRRGLAYKALKQYQQSAQNFLRARELDPDDPRLVLNKKKIYEIKYRKLCEPGEQK